MREFVRAPSRPARTPPAGPVAHASVSQRAADQRISATLGARLATLPLFPPPSPIVQPKRDASTIAMGAPTAQPGRDERPANPYAASRRPTFRGLLDLARSNDGTDFETSAQRPTDAPLVEQRPKPRSIVSQNPVQNVVQLAGKKNDNQDTEDEEDTDEEKAEDKEEGLGSDDDQPSPQQGRSVRASTVAKRKLDDTGPSHNLNLRSNANKKKRTNSNENRDLIRKPYRRDYYGRKLWNGNRPTWPHGFADDFIERTGDANSDDEYMCKTGPGGKSDYLPRRQDIPKNSRKDTVSIGHKTQWEEHVKNKCDEKKIRVEEGRCINGYYYDDVSAAYTDENNLELQRQAYNSSIAKRHGNDRSNQRWASPPRDTDDFEVKEDSESEDSDTGSSSESEDDSEGELRGLAGKQEEDE